jgi:iron complex transport system ATP-binding protein
MENPKNTLLSIDHLSVGYQDGATKNILFENLTVSLNAGELVCFMGPNGIGKSTLIRTLAGLHPPISSLKVGFGVDPQKISVVLTDRITAVNMTVRELVTYGRYPYMDWNIKLSNKDIEIIDRSITLTRIHHLIGKKLYELSDGQLQMSMIARALVQDTPIILLDEPTAHLDLNNRVEIMNLLRNICRTEGKAILVATHELDLALQTADLVWLVGNDRKIRTGIPEDLVLNGSFDEIFQFKGFDLKTGKVFHEAHRNLAVRLIGEGHEFLWTKNALERCGFIITESASALITISGNKKNIEWSFNGQEFGSLRELLDYLTKSLS